MAVDAEKQVRQLPAPVPNLSGVVKPQGTDLTDNQRKVADTIIAHLSAPDYEIPGQEDGKLMEAEKFWLVRRSAFVTDIQLTIVTIHR